MKVQSGISLCALAIVTLALVAEATYDLQRLLDLDEDQYYKRGDTDLDPDWGTSGRIFLLNEESAHKSSLVSWTVRLIIH